MQQVQYKFDEFDTSEMFVLVTSIGRAANFLVPTYQQHQHVKHALKMEENVYTLVFWLQVGQVIAVSGVLESPPSPINFLSKHASQNTCKQDNTRGTTNVCLKIKLDWYKNFYVRCEKLTHTFCSYLDQPIGRLPKD